MQLCISLHVRFQFLMLKKNTTQESSIQQSYRHHAYGVAVFQLPTLTVSLVTVWKEVYNDELH